MPIKVAVVDDEEHLREAVVEYLAASGLQCFSAAGGSELRAIADQEAIDVAILDIAMPGEDGLSIARWLRSRGPRPGIIFATSAGTSLDRVVGLEIGADDYLVKPYELRELLARIRSVSRRLPTHALIPAAPQPPSTDVNMVQIGTLVFNTDTRTLIISNGEEIYLTAAEGDLLDIFIKRPRRVLSRSQLLQLSNNGRDQEGERAVDIRIMRLRRKLEFDKNNKATVRTIRGEGYVFDPG